MTVSWNLFFSKRNVGLNKQGLSKILYIIVNILKTVFLKDFLIQIHFTNTYIQTS